MRYFKFSYYLLPFFWQEVFVGLLSTAGVGLSLINPYLMKLIIDKAYLGKDFQLFIILTFLSALIFILNGLANSLVNYFNRLIKLRLSVNLNREVFSRLQIFPYQFFQDTSTGENLFKIYYDIEQITRFLAEMVPQTILLIPKSILILIIVFKMDFKMALLALALTPLLYLVPFYFAKRLKNTFVVLAEHSQKIFNHLEEILSHIQLVKSFGKAKNEIKIYLKNLEDNMNFGLKSTRLETAGSFANNIINRVVLGAIVFYGGTQVIHDQITLGSFTAIVVYLTQLSGLQSSFAQFFQQISIGLASCDRLNPILEQTISRVKETINFPRTKTLEIEFRKITFCYPNKKPVFKNLNLKITGKNSIALAGSSGSGKTTLINLLLRLYESNSAILINQKPIEKIKTESFYNQIGVVLQEPYLWNDSVKNNILYGKEKATKNEIQWAAEIACASEFINQLPEKYETKIGENACKISEGQKQRIAIARALIKKPKIIIFDEALSSIDGETENKIIKNIKKEFKNSLLIVVSHRLSAIRKMERVYFLNNESEILVGKHQELLQKSKKYQNYIQSQEIVN